MGDQQQPVLEASPAQLHFPPPLNRIITNILQLKNLSPQVLAYKIKTTAPKRYAVRPNTGFLDPGQTFDLQLMLHPQSPEFDMTNAKDKFQIQVVPATSRDLNAIPNMFTERSGDVLEARLMVVFADPAPGGEGVIRLMSRGPINTSLSMMSVTSTAPVAPAPQPTQAPQTAVYQPQPQTTQPQPVPTTAVTLQPPQASPQTQAPITAPQPVQPQPQQVPVVVPAPTQQGGMGSMPTTAPPPPAVNVSQQPTAQIQPVSVPYGQVAAVPAGADGDSAQVADRIAEFEARVQQYERKLASLTAAAAAAGPDGVRQRRAGGSDTTETPTTPSATPGGIVVGGVTLSLMHVLLLCAVLFLLGRLSTKLV